MKIIKGPQPRPQKTVIYGPEGVGKTTLASQFPNPLFVDCEGGTCQLDVARTERPVIYNQLLAILQDIPQEFETIVIDTVDWAERLLINFVCARAKKENIEDFGYGKGYAYVEEEFVKFLDTLSKLNETRHVVLLAHSQISKFEQPDQAGAYDRFSLKLSKKVAPLVKEWCDLMLFLNYYTLVDLDQKTKKAKATGGQERVLYTTHHAAWDAKNRHGLPDMIPAEYASIATCFGKAQPVAAKVNLLELHEEAVNAYLLDIGWVKEGETFRDLSPENATKITARLPDFLKAAGVTA